MMVMYIGGRTPIRSYLKKESFKVQVECRVLANAKSKFAKKLEVNCNGIQEFVNVCYSK